MNTMEVVLVVSSVINILLLILVFLSYNHLSIMKMQITQMHNGLATVLSKLLAMEQVIGKLAVGFGDFVDVTGNLIEKLSSDDMSMEFKQTYRTVDGKYSASSLEELLDKIRKDGSEKNYINDEEIEKLKNLFEEDDNFLDEEE